MSQGALPLQMWISWPFLLYIGERIYDMTLATLWPTHVMGALILDPGVLTLEISKPPGFTYRHVFLRGLGILGSLFIPDMIPSTLHSTLQPPHVMGEPSLGPGALRSALCFGNSLGLPLLTEALVLLGSHTVCVPPVRQDWRL